VVVKVDKRIQVGVVSRNGIDIQKSTVLYTELDMKSEKVGLSTYQSIIEGDL